MAVRCVRALQRCDAPDDPRPAPKSSRFVMVVRCVRAGKSTQAPAAPTHVPIRFKLVMHVLSDSARASTLQPASLKKLFPVMFSLVSAGSLVLMRCSSSAGRSGCASAALPPKPKEPATAVGKTKAGSAMGAG